MNWFVVIIIVGAIFIVAICAVALALGRQIDKEIREAGEDAVNEAIQRTARK